MGGKTIAEAKNNLSYEEFMFWSAYRNFRGSLFIGRRIEQGFGNLSATYLASKGAKDIKAISFMPHEDQPEDEILTVDEMMQKGIG
ncbi:hypothetical protein [Acinetobacter sp. YH12123]|uniref:phage tail assembly protein T n=2 Tax=unclassified Acinetobacter TaxID=196816 RepID=UPI001C5540D6